MGATANRFENDLVRQAQADCFTFFISLIIPQKDRGGLPVSLTQIESADRSYESDTLSLDGTRRFGCRDVPRWLQKSMAGYCGLSQSIICDGQPARDFGLRSPIPLRSFPRDTKWEHGRERRQDEVTERDTNLVYCMWSDCTGGLGLAGNGHLLLLFFIIFHQGHLQLTPSERL